MSGSRFNFSIQNIAKNGDVDPLWEGKLYDFCQRFASSDREEKYLNYTPEGLDLTGHLTFDALVVEDEIVSFCGIYNGGRYPRGVYRILNRSFTRPDYRSSGLGVRLLNSQFLVPIQIQNYVSQIDLAFVSIQEPHLRRALAKIVKQIKSPYLSNWQYAEGMVQVALCEAKACYQNVIYSPLTNDYKKFPLKTVTFDEYANLPAQ